MKEEDYSIKKMMEEALKLLSMNLKRKTLN
jgi:hypothetical protein